MFTSRSGGGPGVVSHIPVSVIETLGVDPLTGSCSGILMQPVGWRAEEGKSRGNTVFM